jgi:uncharacterized membrane protein required for colicin V production
MNWVDAAIILLVISNAMTGYLMGFVWQAAGMATLVVGTLLAWFLVGPVSVFTGLFTQNVFAAQVLAFLLIFGAVSLSIKLFASVIRVWVKRKGGEIHDQRLGIMLGVANALVLSAIVCTGYRVYNPAEKSVSGSLTGSSLARVGRMFVSDETAQHIIREGRVQEMKARQALEAEERRKKRKAGSKPRDAELKPEPKDPNRPLTPSDIRDRRP